MPKIFQQVLLEAMIEKHKLSPDDQEILTTYVERLTIRNYNGANELAKENRDREALQAAIAEYAELFTEESRPVMAKGK